MKHFQSLLAVSLILLLAANAHSDAAYKGKVEMIETAAAIAVVEITGTEKVSVKGKQWIYQQKASAKVEQVLKSNLADRVSLYGDENFLCAQCHFEAGRYLVFLDRDGDLLTGNNWQLSTHKITGEAVEWLDDVKFFEKKVVALSGVLQEIEQALAKAKPAAPKQS